MARSAEAAGTPPYLPWVTFKNFLTGMKGAVPPRIDASVLKGKSGSDQSGLKTALRFLQLIEEPGDRTTAALRSVTDAVGSEEWPTVLRDVVLPAYRELLGELDVKGATLGQLEETFSAAGVKGVRDKAIRFWLAAMKEADVTVSPHFGPVGAPSNERPRRGRGKRAKNGSAQEQPEDQASPPPPNFTEHNFALPGRATFRLWLPEDLSPAEWVMVDAYIRGFISLRNGTEG